MITPNERAIRILINADLKHGNDNEVAIKDLIKKEDYETLSVIKSVFEETGKKLPI